MNGSALVRGLTTGEAARQLGVDQSRVRQLLLDGDLHGERLSSGQWIVSGASVAERETTRPSPCRKWNSDTAWLVLEQLEYVDWSCGTKSTHATASSRHRVRNYLVHWDVEQLAAKLIGAIPFKRFDAQNPEKVARELLLSGRSRASQIGGGLRDRSDVADGYVTSEQLSRLERTYGLIQSDEGNVSIGIVPDEVDNAQGVWRALIALDLARSTSTRERSAGLSALEKCRSRWLAGSN